MSESTSSRAEASGGFYLPDFCAARRVLGVVLIVELTALTLALARASDVIDFWTDLARTSMFLLWIGLAATALLCALRERFARAGVGSGSIAALLSVTALVGLISELTYRLGASEFFSAVSDSGLFPKQHLAFVARNCAISFIVTGVALRYFYVTYGWRRSVELQAQARVHALHARIRPHFLFNSMNTIAALTRSDPPRAEDAVQDLADLFRATLSDKRSQMTLAEEIEVAQTYQRIEQLRLGNRLHVEWRTDPLPKTALVPGLMLQPLLENAIYHGIEPRSEGGTVSVKGELANGLITLVVRNPLPSTPVERDGNRLALANIRERLELLYGPRATIKAGVFDDEFIVTLRFPHIEPDEEPAE